jgi:zinc/manganese transport system substrate-binding protein
VLSDTLELFTRHQVAALFSNDQTSGPITDQVEAAARSAGVPVVPMSETLPDDMSYLTWMSQNISRVADAVTRP